MNVMIKLVVIFSMSLGLLSPLSLHALSESCEKLKTEPTKPNIIMCGFDGLSLIRKKQCLEAKDSFELILLVKPDHADSIKNRGLSYLCLENQKEALMDFQNALALLDDAITKNKTDAALYYTRGSLFRNLRLYDNAIADLEEAIKLNPQRINYPTDLKMVRVQAKPPLKDPVFTMKELRGGN